GPGSFTWCAGSPACGPTGPPNAGGRNGRVIYRPGANRFGGVMQMGLGVGGEAAFTYRLAPFLAAHLPLGYPQPQAVGGGGNDVPWIAITYQKAGFVTKPLTIPSKELIRYPGPKVTTMFGLTNTMPGGKLLTLKHGTTPMGLPFWEKATNFGFPFATGTVIVQ